MRSKSKKGFTIVELVIVVAVIAILAAVLIPTFSNLIKKANLSSDQVAVRNMNNALAMDEAVNGKPVDLLDAMKRMQENGYDFDSYKKARLRVNHDYCDRIAFGRKCLMNVASAGKFSSDRTIRQYNEDIWHLT